MKLWLIRHASVLLPADVCYGVSDVAADPDQTLYVAKAFADYPGKGCAIWSSPLQRTLSLVEAIYALRPDLQSPCVVQHLREMDFGSWEMQAWTQIPKSAIDAWVADFANHRFGGRESTQEVIDRVALVLNEARTAQIPELVWVTHAGVMRAVEFLLRSSCKAQMVSCADWPMSEIKPGSWVCWDL